MKVFLLTIDRVAGWLLLIGALVHGYFSIDLIFQCDFVSFCKKTTYTCIMIDMQSY